MTTVEHYSKAFILQDNTWDTDSLTAPNARNNNQEYK